MSEAGNHQHQQRDQQQNGGAAASGGAIIDTVVSSFFWIGQPAHATRCFETQAVAKCAFYRSTCGNPFFDGWYSYSNFHEALSCTNRIEITLRIWGRTLCAAASSSVQKAVNSRLCDIPTNSLLYPSPIFSNAFDRLDFKLTSRYPISRLFQFQKTNYFLLFLTGKFMVFVRLKPG